MSADGTAASGGGAAADLGRVLVLAGGLSHERDVSLRSGRRVADALLAAGVPADLADTDADLLPNLEAHPPDAVFIALHGGSGEDGAVRDVLDLLGVPYVGTPGPASRVAFDKPTAKAVVARAGLRTPAWLTLPHATFRELGASALVRRISDHLGLPLVVKPASGGSALGTTVVHHAGELPGALVAAYSYGPTALLEHYVAGTEVAVAVTDPGDGSAVALPAVEIVVPGGGLYDYTARYTAGSTDFFAPARLDPPAAAAAAQAALAAHAALGLRDISRTDAIVDETGAVHFLEVNVSPGMTETSTLPLAVAAAGLDLGKVLIDLLRGAAARRS